MARYYEGDRIGRNGRLLSGCMGIIDPHTERLRDIWDGDNGPFIR